MIPKVMGMPLWYGNIKRRVAKKYLSEPFRCRQWLKSLANVSVGSLINDCSAFNTRITELNPHYYKVGKGYVLGDITITNHKGGCCSLINCGVELPKSRESILEYWKRVCEYHLSHGDEWEFAKRYEFTTVDEEGKAIFDSIGYKGKYE